MQNLLNLYLKIQLKRKDQKEGGFSLLEIVVVLVIIGILSALTVPSLLGVVNRAKVSSAANDIGILNRSQSSFLSQNQRFATTIGELASGVPTETGDYTFSATVVGTGVNAYALNTALPKRDILNGVAGKVLILETTPGFPETQLIICVGQPGQVPDMSSVVSEETCPVSTSD